VDLVSEFLDTLANVFDFFFGGVLPHRNHHRRSLLKQKARSERAGRFRKSINA
jgi:hypothetical protein